MKRKKGFKPKYKVECMACGRILHAQRRKHISSPLFPIPHSEASGLRCLGLSIPAKLVKEDQNELHIFK